LFFLFIYFFILCKFFDLIIYEYIIVITYKNIKIIKKILNKNKNLSLFLNLNLNYYLNNFKIIKSNKLNLIIFNLFFWIFYNNFRYNNFKYFIVYYIYYLNLIKLFLFLKKNNINYYIMNSNYLNKKLDKIILKKFIKYLINTKKVKLIFCNDLKLNFNYLINLNIDYNLLIFFLYLNYN